MQERNLRIIALRATRVRCPRLQPASREELFGVCPPEVPAAVDGPGDEEHAGSFWDGLGADVSGACGLADGEGDGGVEAEGFVADGVEDWEGFDFGVGGDFAGRD